MKKSGFVVRFVDVVLILLFGFISISSVRSTAIELPESTETAAPPPEMEEVVFIAIRTDGTYLVDDERREIRGARNLLEWVEEEVENGNLIELFREDSAGQFYIHTLDVPQRASVRTFIRWLRRQSRNDGQVTT